MGGETGLIEGKAGDGCTRKRVKSRWSGRIIHVTAVGSRFFPLDKAWGLTASVYSPAVRGQMTWLSGLLTYGKAAEVMMRIGKQGVSDSSLWRVAQQVGADLLDTQDTALPPSRAGTGSPAHTQL